MAREDEIKLIAYSIWEEEGCPGGRDCEHWYQAEIIWEQQNKKPAAKSAATEAKKPVQRNTKVTAERKKTPRK